MIKINKKEIDEETFVEVVDDFLDHIIIIDYNSHAYVCKILIRDKLNYFKTCSNKNEVAKEINEIMLDGFGVSFK